MISLIESFGVSSPLTAARNVEMSLRSPTANRRRWRGRSWLMLSTLPRSWGLSMRTRTVSSSSRLIGSQ